MKKLSSFGVSLTAAAFLVMFMEKPAHAYLDAGTGSMVVQLLLAGTAGLAVLGKLLIQRIVAFFRLTKSADTVAE